MTQTTSRVRPTGEHPAPVAPAPTSPAARVQDSASRAATQVDGVHALGSAGGRALVRALGRVPGGRPSYGSGVSVEVGPEAVALDVSLVLEHGAKAVDVADRVRSVVDASVAQETGLHVVEVNVTIADVHHPSDDVARDPAPEPAVAQPTDTQEAGADPLDAPPVDLDQAELTYGSASVDQQGDGAGVQDTLVVLEPGGAGPSDAPQLVHADEVVVADRVVVVREQGVDGTPS